MKMNLAEMERRVEQLECGAGRQRECLPVVVLELIEPVQDENGRMRPGRCVGHWRIAPGEPSRMFDEDMNPVVRGMEAHSDNLTTDKDWSFSDE